MTKAAQAKSWSLYEWADGSYRSWPEPEIPTYISALAENEIAALSSVSNGVSTYFAAAGAAWRADPPLTFQGESQVYTQHVEKADSYSGGIGNVGERICYMHGGGHAASFYNGVIGFDFKGDSQPTGFFLVPGSESPDPNDTDTDPTTDGRPLSVHTYDGMAFDETNRRIWRVGGSPPAGGFLNKDWYLPADGNASANPWVDNGPRNVTFDTPSGTVKLAYDPTSNKVLCVGDNYCRFLNLATGEWSGTKANYDTGMHMTAVFVPDSSGSSSGEVFSLGQDATRKASVDFDAETVGTWTVVSPTGDTGWTSDEMLAAFWDEVLEVLWIFGGRDDGSANGTLDDFYRFVPSTGVSAKVTVTGTMPVIDNDTDSNTYGLNKRFVYISEWRSVGIVTVYNQPAYVWKLPSS